MKKKFRRVPKMIKPNMFAMKTLLTIFAFTITTISSKNHFVSSFHSNHVSEASVRQLRPRNEFNLRATKRRNLYTDAFTSSSTINAVLDKIPGKHGSRRVQEETETEDASETPPEEGENPTEEEADGGKSPLEQVTDTFDTVRDKTNETFKSDPRSWDATNWGIAGGILVFAFIVVSCVLKKCCCRGK